MSKGIAFVIVALLALLLAFGLSAPETSAFSSPIPRPTLDPAWVCQQLGNCPKRERTERHHHESIIVLPAPVDV